MSPVPPPLMNERNPVAELLLERRAKKSKPNERVDGRKVALAIEGGGMRAIVSGAMVAALEELDLLNSFDAVYGCSGGGIAGAYFLAQQARQATTMFYDNLNDRRFINFPRLWVGRPVISLEYLFDHVCIHDRPLAVGRVLNSPIPLVLIGASLTKRTSVALRDFENPQSLFGALRSSTSIPVFAGPPVEYRGDRFVDGSLYESIPFGSAIRNGATDVVVLLTRPRGNLRNKPGFLERKLVAPHLGRIHPTIAEQYLSRAQHYQSELDEIEQRSKGIGPVSLLPIQLDDTGPIIRQLEKSRPRLVRGAMAGFRAVYRALNIPVLEITSPIAYMRSRRRIFAAKVNEDV